MLTKNLKKNQLYKKKTVFEYHDLIDYKNENIKAEKLIISSIIFFEKNKMLISLFKVFIQIEWKNYNLEYCFKANS